jgi:hypothetical protein
MAETMSEKERLSMLEGFDAYLVDGGVSAGGSSLSHSLAFPSIGAKGEFSYLGTSQILSYVIAKRAGMTPRQYLMKKVMPHLGIGESQYRWYQTNDGVEFAFHGLELTALQMAKFGQLYLQSGQSKPSEAVDSTSRTRTSGGHQVISKEWVDDSFKPYAKDETFFKLEYGYLFWKTAENTYCAFGAFGQDICIDRNTGRVTVQQRDPNPDLDLITCNYIIGAVASDPELSFDAVPAPLDVDPSEDVSFDVPYTSDDVGASSNLRPASATALFTLGLLSLLL